MFRVITERYAELEPFVLLDPVLLPLLVNLVLDQLSDVIPTIPVCLSAAALSKFSKRRNLKGEVGCN